MPLNFKLPKVVIRRPGRGQAGRFEGAMGEGLAAPEIKADPLKIWKIVLGVLVVANIAAFFLLFKPVGGSAADLEAQLANLQMQIKRQQLSLRSSRELASKLEKARGEHVRFMDTYFMDRRTMSSTILSEIKDSAAAAGLVPKEHSFGFEPIEGTENLGMMTITANYEGTYADLVKFVNLIDRSKRFLIIDNIQAAPQQQGAKLVSRFKINAFVREMPRAALPATSAAPLESIPAKAASVEVRP
jgi:Tfp pilus assembly protein PilO